jgi:hypothetical protein
MSVRAKEMGKRKHIPRELRQFAENKQRSGTKIVLGDMYTNFAHSVHPSLLRKPH